MVKLKSSNTIERVGTHWGPYKSREAELDSWSDNNLFLAATQLALINPPFALSCFRASLYRAPTLGASPSKWAEARVMICCGHGERDEGSCRSLVKDL